MRIIQQIFIIIFVGSVFYRTSGSAVSLTSIQASGNPLIIDIVWSPNGEYIAYSDIDGNVGIISPITQTVVFTLPQMGADPHGFGGIRVAWSPNSQSLAVSAYTEIQIWDSISWTHQTTLTQSTILPPTLSAIAWSPDGSKLAGVSYEGRPFNLRVWDVNNSKEIMTIQTTGYLYSVDWGINGSTLITTRGNRVQIWDLGDPNTYEVYSGQAGEIVIAKEQPNGGYIASAGADSRIFIWDTITHSPVFTLVGQESDMLITNLDWKFDGIQLASVSDNGSLWVWDIFSQQGLLIAQIDGPLYGVAWSPDGTQIAYGGANGVVEIIPAPEFLTCDYHVTPNDADGLVQSVQQANLDASATICLEDGGVLSFTTATGSSAIPTITGNLTFMPVIRNGDITIEGNGATLTRDETADLFRFFEVAPGGSLTLNNLTLNNGAVDDAGGAILNHGTLAINGSTLTDNYAHHSGGAIYNTGQLDRYEYHLQCQHNGCQWLWWGTRHHG